MDNFIQVSSASRSRINDLAARIKDVILLDTSDGKIDQLVVSDALALVSASYNLKSRQLLEHVAQFPKQVCVECGSPFDAADGWRCPSDGHALRCSEKCHDRHIRSGVVCVESFVLQPKPFAGYGLPADLQRALEVKVGS